MSSAARSAEPRPQSAAAPSPFPPIADYAFLSNCHTGALVAPDGAIDWLCVPAFDSPSVFGSLLDREAGALPVRAVRDQPSDGARLRARDERARDDLEDAERLARRPRRADDGPDATTRTRSRRTPGRRPTTTPSTCWCARSSASTGASRSSSSASRRSTTAATPAEWSLVDGDRHTADATGAGQTIRLRHGPRARHRGQPRPRPARARGGRHALTARCPGPSELAAPADVDDAEAQLDATTRFWRALARRRARIPDHRWRDPIQRSALAIKGLTYMPTGATVAALTTSLPETPGGERNWDYRYTWMRDTTFTLQALHYLNLDWEADEFMQFVADLEPNEDGALQIMYGIDGRRDLTESTRDDLSGYAGARPVRIGNGAFDQRQNDVFGAVLDSILLHTRRSERLPAAALADRRRRRPSARRAVWREPDQGIWEARGKPQHYVSSKLMCWVALDRAAKLAEIRGDPELGRAVAGDRRRDPRGHPRARRQRPRRAAPALRDRRRSTPRRCWRRSSASCPADDERLRASVLAIADELTEDGFVLRYRTDETDDGLSGKEGTFLICSFWLVSGARDRRRAAAGPGPDGAAAADRLAARALRRGVRRRDRAATSATSRRRSRTWR